jgi:phospholipid/cholesterol/gamma-HCH transport system substrate-binding protein
MSQAIKVGIFGTLCLVILAVLIWKIEDINPFHQKGERIDAIFATVAGLDDKASVRVAGVKIGKVDGIGLAGEKARVSMLLERPIRLTVGTRARISNMGLLGDKYVELVPGPPGAPPLPPGTILAGEAPVSFDQAIAKIDKIGDSIQGITGQLNSGPGGGAVVRLLTSLESTANAIRALVIENRMNVDATVANLNQVSATLARELPRLAGEMERTVGQISQLVEENRGDVKGSFSNIRELTGNLQTSVDNLNRISGKIASGQGTVGKLINDEEAYQKAVSTLDSIKGGVESVSSTIGALQKFRFDLDLSGYAFKKDSQSNLMLDIDPQNGPRLYRAGLSTTPSGSVTTKTQVITTTLPDGSKQVETIDRVETQNSKVLTALLGYRAPSDLRLWAGLIEGAGGVQAEYPWRRTNLQFKFDAFDFNRPENKRPHLRLSTRWQFTPNLYLIGGYDDPLENHSFFLGGGIRWNDENIKYLLGALGGLAGK